MLSNFLCILLGAERKQSKDQVRLSCSKVQLTSLTPFQPKLGYERRPSRLVAVGQIFKYRYTCTTRIERCGSLCKTIIIDRNLGRTLRATRERRAAAALCSARTNAGARRVRPRFPDRSDSLTTKRNPHLSMRVPKCLICTSWY